MALAGLWVLLAAVALRAVEPDDRFVRIYTLIQQADALKKGGREDQARQKYVEARGELESLRKEYPGWNESVVEFRLKYIAEKLGQNGDLSGKSPADAEAAKASRAGESNGTVQLLQGQVRQLTADKELLQARLKEALTAQPAAVDPRELARAEERIKVLEKQVGVLKANLEKAESKPDKPVDPVVLEDARKALDVVSQKLARQTELTATATLEKEALQKRLQAFIDGDEIRALRSENESLRRRAGGLAATADAQTGAPANGNEKPEGRPAEPAERRGAAVALKTNTPGKGTSERETIAPTNVVMVSALQTALRSVQQERDELQRKLDAATRELDDFRARKPSAQTNPRTDRATVSGLRTGVFDTGKPSGPPEEQALLKPPDTTSPERSDATGKKPSGMRPPAESPLLTEAARAFAAHRYEEAEKKYSAALRIEGKNANVLVRLAAVQIEQGRLADAERNLGEALMADPKDTSSLSLLGTLKIREKKYDAALDALSRAAQLDPTNADIFQHLGVALAEKGLREPAESAFRRALQLAPDNPGAHHGLAAVYAGRHPPSLELARRHYQKALQAGGAKDPELEKVLDAHKPGVPSK